MTEVSIIMGARGREENTRRTLQSYQKLSYVDYELLFVDVIHKENLKSLYKEFETLLPIKYLSLQENFKIYVPNATTWTPATTWNYGIRQSTGKFIITCSADILLSYPDMIEKFLEQYRNNRLSVLTYFLNRDMTNSLDSYDWIGNPDSIQLFSGCWEMGIDGTTNSSRKAAGLTTYITGQPRERWDYFGLFREELGHLVNDQDLVMREACLNLGAETLNNYVGYHQAHPLSNDIFPHIACPGWHYENEAQARLLEPAPRDMA